jgi:hypothetical protein
MLATLQSDALTLQLSNLFEHLIAAWWQFASQNRALMLGAAELFVA